MPLTPAPDDVFTMTPPPARSMSGISCFMHRNTPRRLTSTIRSHSSSVISAIGVDRLLDAGIVEREVEATERLDRSVQGGLHVLGPRHVAGDGESAPSGLLDQ